ncbi:MAG: J domain-containing protein [Ktedonobacteraceae bacterium]
MSEKTIEQHFRVLGLEPGATLAEVKEAYRFLVQTFHEDKYPPHSTYQEKAHQKMVEINDAYEKLKKFFADNPSGQPAGGWRTDPGKQAEYRTGRDGEMDWQAWQKDQEESWQSEMKEWYEADIQRRKQCIDDEEKKRRQTIVKATKIGLVVAFIYLCIGHTADHSLRTNSNYLNDALVREKLQYDLATHGTANGAYAQSPDQIASQDLPLVYAQNSRDQRESDANGLSTLLLFGVGGAIGWMLFSRKGTAAVGDYIDSGSFAHAFKGLK